MIVIGNVSKILPFKNEYSTHLRQTLSRIQRKLNVCKKEIQKEASVYAKIWRLRIEGSVQVITWGPVFLEYFFKKGISKRVVGMSKS